MRNWPTWLFAIVSGAVTGLTAYGIIPAVASPVALAVLGTAWTAVTHRMPPPQKAP